jgi:lysozyme
MTVLSSARFGAMVNMAFNLGVDGLGHFHHMLDAMKAKDWDRAAQEALNSTWAGQVGERAQRVAQQIRRDQWV